MNHVRFGRVPSFVVLGALAATSAVLSIAGCSISTKESNDPNVGPESNHDAGVTETPPVEVQGPTTTEDAGATTPDACADGGCNPPPPPPAPFCSTRGVTAFCDDFDADDALMPGKTKWDFLEPSTQPVLTLSPVAANGPNGLLTRIIDATTPGAKFAKTIGKANLVEATWEYDVNFEHVGEKDGFFLDDFQFMGNDEYGWRLVMFAKDDATGTINELKVEHNRPGALGNYVIEPPLTAGTVQNGKWHHFKQSVKFTFAEGGNTADYKLEIDAAQAFAKTYPAPARADVAFARFAGMPFVFNKGNSSGLKIHWDNQVLDLK